MAIRHVAKLFCKLKNSLSVIGYYSCNEEYTNGNTSRQI